MGLYHMTIGGKVDLKHFTMYINDITRRKSSSKHETSCMAISHLCARHGIGMYKAIGQESGESQKLCFRKCRSSSVLTSEGACRRQCLASKTPEERERRAVLTLPSETLGE